MPHTLECRNLAVSVDGKSILKGVNLILRSGEFHALMGPNGSGKSTLAMTLMGHPRYSVTGGQILLNNEDITAWLPERRAQAGLFLSFQYPQEIPGVPYAQFLRTAYHAVHHPAVPLPFSEFQERLISGAHALKFGDEVLARSVNEGFSGGEKKRAEILQLNILQPKFAILDEPDSGLDIDALKTVSEALQQARTAERGFLVITHYPRMLQYLKPDAVHVFVRGRVVRSGGADIATELEKSGYDAFNAHEVKV